MKMYERLLKLKVFSLNDVNQITGNESTSTSLLSRLMKKNYVVRVRKNLYTCIDLSTGEPYVNAYQIASAINSTAYVSFHSAFEFYGLANQIYNVIYVSSEKRFNDFEFNGMTYKYIKSVNSVGVVKLKNIDELRITDLERTFIDSVNYLSKISGIEEMIKITAAIEYLNSDKLLQYLKLFNKKVLYQKVGYFLENYYSGDEINADFFEECVEKSGNSIRYLIGNVEGIFDSKWNLIIPKEYSIKTQVIGDVDEYI